MRRTISDLLYRDDASASQPASQWVRLCTYTRLLTNLSTSLWMWSNYPIYIRGPACLAIPSTSSCSSTRQRQTRCAYYSASVGMLHQPCTHTRYQANPLTIKIRAGKGNAMVCGYIDCLLYLILCATIYSYFMCEMDSCDERSCAIAAFNKGLVQVEKKDEQC